MGSGSWNYTNFSEYSSTQPQLPSQERSKIPFSSFKKLAGVIWKPNFERAGISSTFSPEFYKVIGMENPEEYNSVLRFLYQKASAFEGCAFFANEVPTSPDFDMISYLSAELANMNLKALPQADITLFSKPATNAKFLSNLQTIVDLYESKNSFMNQSVKIDFIVKMMLWMNTYFRPIEKYFEDTVCPKCIYYGDITKHEEYFLLLVYFMGVDVLYINPLKDSMTDLPQLDCINVITYPHISQVGNIMSRINSAEDINFETSTTAQLMDEIQNEIFTSGVFRAWQLKDHNITPCKKVFTIYDLKNNVTEPAKVRDGFKVEGQLVTTPNVFFQVDGVPTDLEEYADLIQLIYSQENCYKDPGNGSLLTGGNPEEDLLQLVFCRVGEREYSMEEFRKLSFYRWNQYNKSVEKKLCNALNRTLKDNVLISTMDDQKEFQFVSDILSISEVIIKLLDNYDYAEKIPKVFIFLDNETFLPKRVIPVLAFIYELGFDVIIYNPSGLKSVTSAINEDVVSHIRYDKMVYDMTLTKAMSKKKAKKGFWASLFQ